jgi:hypothetical protein
MKSKEAQKIIILKGGDGYEIETGFFRIFADCSVLFGLDLWSISKPSSCRGTSEDRGDHSSFTSR